MRELPPKGLSLFPIWLLFILEANKRIENRSRFIAGQIGDYRGPVLLTATLGHHVPQWHNNGQPILDKHGNQATKRRPMSHASGYMPSDVASDIRSIWRQHRHKISESNGEALTSLDLSALQAMAGHAIATAEIVAVRDPIASSADYWHADGQYGIRLDNVQPIEPFAVKGGQGFWNVEQCKTCPGVYADSQRRNHKCPDTTEVKT